MIPIPDLLYGLGATLKAGTIPACAPNVGATPMTDDRLTEIKARVAREIAGLGARHDISDLEYALWVIANYEEVLEDRRRIAREMEVTMFGAGAAKQPALCDIQASVTKLVAERDRLRTALLELRKIHRPDGETAHIIRKALEGKT